MNKLRIAVGTTSSSCMMLACCIVTFALWNVVFIFKTAYLMAPPGPPVPAAPPPPPSLFSIRNLTGTRSQAYELKGDIRIHGNSTTIFIASSSSSSSSLMDDRQIPKPYAVLQFDEGNHRNATEFKIRVINTNNNHEAASLLPNCTRNFGLPVLVFGYSKFIGNPFHDMSDNLIPLYLTSRHFNATGTTRFLLLKGNMKRAPWWNYKYRLFLKTLSDYDVMDVSDGSTNNEVMCFPHAIIGLVYHDHLSIDPSRPPHYSIQNFTHFLRSAYSLPRDDTVDCRRRRHKVKKQQPRLLIISRNRTRRLTNAAELAEAGRQLGFDVVVTELGWQVATVAALVNSADVMVGVHGAGLTNMVFLPRNAVLVQIVPVRVEVVSGCYGVPTVSGDMGLRYMEYRIGLNESTLTEKQLERVANRTYVEYALYREVYLLGQNVKVDVRRFKETVLSKALDHVLLSAAH